MYRIAICDDEQAWLKRIENMTKVIMNNQSIPYEVTSFQSYEALYDVLKEGKGYHLFLLDILLKGPQGLELAKLLRKQGKESGIIFISSTPDFVLEGYDVQAIKYLLKPPALDQLQQAILFDYHRQCRNPGQTILLNCRSRLLTIQLKDLAYLEALTRKVHIHMVDGGEEIVPGRLVDYESQLPTKWCGRCHVSFCVNLAQVKKVARDTVTLKNEVKLPVGRKYREAFKGQLLASLK